MRIRTVLIFILFVICIWQISLIILNVFDLLIGIEITNNEIEFNKKNETTIPRLIHQMWKTEDLSTYPINNSHLHWKLIYPNYQIKLWIDKDIEELFQLKHSKDLYLVYKSYLYSIQRSDLARLVILYHYGGIYVDLDVYPSYENLEDLILKNISFLIGRSSSDVCLVNHFLISEKSSHIIQMILNQIQIKSFFKQIYFLPYLEVFSTGSIFLTKILRKRIQNFNSKSDRLVILSKNRLSRYISHGVGRSWHLFDGFILNFIGEHPYRFISFIVVFSFILVLMKKKKIYLFILKSK